MMEMVELNILKQITVFSKSWKLYFLVFQTFFKFEKAKLKVTKWRARITRFVIANLYNNFYAMDKYDLF